MSRVNPSGVLVEFNGETMQILRQDSLRATIAMALKDFEEIDSQLQGADPRDYRFKRLVGDSEVTVGESMFQAERESRTYKVKIVLVNGRRPTTAPAPAIPTVETRRPASIVPGASVMLEDIRRSSRRSATQSVFAPGRSSASLPTLRQLGNSIWPGPSSRIIADKDVEASIAASLPPVAPELPPALRKIGSKPRIALKVQLKPGKVVIYQVGEAYRLKNLLAAIATDKNWDVERLKLISEDFTSLDASETPKSLDLSDGDTVRIHSCDEESILDRIL